MTAGPFADLRRAPAEHFTLWFYSAVARVLEQASAILGGRAAAFEHFPFLAGYHAEMARRGAGDLSGEAAVTWWHEAVASWEATTDGHLPLRALGRAAGLDRRALTLLVAAGLVEEDARFGLLFEAMQGIHGVRRPTLGLLDAWWRDDTDRGQARAALRRLVELGLIETADADAPRAEQAVRVPTMLWDALHGDLRDTPAPWLSFTPPDRLPDLGDLIVPESVGETLRTVPGLLASDEVRALVVRGPARNGRRTLVGAAARALGRGLLLVRGPLPPDDPRWRLVGSLATLTNAVPCVRVDLGPGETAEVPRLDGYDGPVAAILGQTGGLVGSDVEQGVTLTLGMPEPSERGRHWEAGLTGRPADDLDRIVERFRMTGGNIRRAARLAGSYAALDGRPTVTLADVQPATRAINRQALDALAARVPTEGDWSYLATSPETYRELCDLERRCRHREDLRAAVGDALRLSLTPGVRALLRGPSGTGKTLAAHLLASVLEKDLYRLDLSTVVNKYIGETEKNLAQVFARAEELDVILLLDEGDALLTRRTSVQTSNDRYANLETNYLLQRLESFEGILIVTTNAGQRIDEAFQRRMDVVIDFHPPGVAERRAIWDLHLPARHHVPSGWLDELAFRCAVSGGQIRNAVLHASLLALDDGGAIVAAHLEAAVRREYRKLGAVCPLRVSPGLARGGNGSHAHAAPG